MKYSLAEIFNATHNGMARWGFNWGYAQTILINGEDVPITWVHVDEHEDGQWHTDLKAVMQLQGDNRFFVKEGYYQSHEGSYWDGSFYEAKPVERTVIDWEEVK